MAFWILVGVLTLPVVSECSLHLPEEESEEGATEEEFSRRERCWR